MKQIALPCLIMSAVCGLTACNKTTTGIATPAVTTTPAAPAAAYYTEIEHDGRIYVIGSEDMAAKFKELHHLPYTDTRIGAGPNGETVVVEVDKNDPSHQERLWKAYATQNLFYDEVKHEGRIYVLGSPESLKSFKAMHHMPYTHTRIGAGPKGETLVFEVDKKNPALQYRLIRTFATKHHLTL